MRPSLRRQLCAASLALTLLPALPAAAREGTPGADLDTLLACARAHNPQLAAQRQEAAAARERIAPAGALPDPRFQLELMNFTNAMNGGGASLLPGEVGQTRYRLIQPIPFPGKRGMRADIATALAEQGDSTAEALRLEVESRIKTSYARYYQAAGQSAIFGETLALLEALARLVETRYGVGLVPQQDVLRAHSEITALKLELIEAERRRRDAAARLNTQLPRPADAPLATPRHLPPLAAAPALAGLAHKARERSPELARSRHGIAAAQGGRALTQLDRYPDFTLGLTNNRPQNGTDNWDLMLEVTVPLQQSARRANEREAEHRLDAAKRRLEAAETQLDGRLGEALAAFEANRDKAALLSATLLPQARATLESAQAGYESGRVNFNTLIEAERQILRTRLALLDAEVEAVSRQAELEQLVGEAL
jgi:outer membrane protein TolC